MAIRHLPLPVDLTNKLEICGYTNVEDVIRTPLSDMQMSTGLTIQKLRDVYEKAYLSRAPAPLSAKELLRDSSRLRVSFGLREIDDILGGGLCLGTLTELSGAPGLGKTQLCNLIALHTSVYNQKGVVYLDTEGSFTVGRLLSIGQLRYPEILYHDDCLDTAFHRIKVLKPQSLNELVAVLRSMDVFLIKNQCRLLIIDSIASLSRRDFGQSRAVERASLLCTTASLLKTLAYDLNIAVLIVNHVTCPRQEDSTPNPKLISALGASWAHWINTKIYLSRDSHSYKMEIAKSPEMPELTVHYKISEDGIQTTSRDHAQEARK